jgi:hypothetical protein
MPQNITLLGRRGLRPSHPVRFRPLHLIVGCSLAHGNQTTAKERGFERIASAHGMRIHLSMRRSRAKDIACPRIELSMLRIPQPEINSERC